MAGAEPGELLLAVVGAHLAGEPLHHQLTDVGARLVRTARAAPTYRLFALPGGPPAKPGLVGGYPAQGEGVEVEVYALGAEALGRVLAPVAAPLCIGTVTLADGTAVKGFLCEAHAVAGAQDITAHGGWRAYRATVS